ARKAVRASGHRRRRMATRPAGHLGRRLWPLPAAARHGEDRLSLPAQRYVGGTTSLAGGVGRKDSQGKCRHSTGLGGELALWAALLGYPSPRCLSRGRPSIAAHRRDAEARHCRDNDWICAFRPLSLPKTASELAVGVS